MLTWGLEAYCHIAATGRPISSFIVISDPYRLLLAGKDDLGVILIGHTS